MALPTAEMWGMGGAGLWEQGQEHGFAPCVCTLHGDSAHRVSVVKPHASKVVKQSSWAGQLASVAGRLGSSNCGLSPGLVSPILAPLDPILSAAAK